MATDAARRRWTCPDCQRVFKIPAGSETPERCPECWEDWEHRPRVAPPVRAPQINTAPQTYREPRRPSPGVMPFVTSGFLFVTGALAFVLGMLCVAAVLSGNLRTTFDLIFTVGLLMLACVNIGMSQIIRLLATR